jgi:hypothetical protein
MACIVCNIQKLQHRFFLLLSSNFEPDKHKCGVDLINWLGNNGSTDIHERVKESSQIRGRSLEGDNESRAFKTLFSEIQ